jgi:hypothetical protein
LAVQRDATRRAEADVQAARRESAELRRRHAASLQAERAAASSALQAQQQQILAPGARPAGEAGQADRSLVRVLAEKQVRGAPGCVRASVSRCAQTAVWELERLRGQLDAARADADSAVALRAAAIVRVELAEVAAPRFSD